MEQTQVKTLFSSSVPLSIKHLHEGTEQEIKHPGITISVSLSNKAGIKVILVTRL